MAQVQVICLKHNANGNTVHRSNQNPILDTCLYEVKFPMGKITELADNVIAESMCAQCDVNGNEYHSLIIEKMIQLSMQRIRKLQSTVEGDLKKVSSLLGLSLQVERWHHIMGEVIQS